MNKLVNPMIKSTFEEIDKELNKLKNSDESLLKNIKENGL